MTAPIAVGIVDSGVRSDAGLRVAAARRFVRRADGAVSDAPPSDDSVGHGTEVARIVAAEAADADLLIAQAFDGSFRGAPDLVAAGIDWLVEAGARLVTLSFGLAADRPVLRAACEAAVGRHAILVASAPAQGPACYPAAYPGVIAVTGDARCAKRTVSDLQGGQADFGTWCASPEQRPENAPAPVVGASAAAAHFTGLAAVYLTAHSEAAMSDLMAHFRSAAVHVGPERRVADRARAVESKRG